MQGIGRNRKNLPARIKTEQKVESQKKMKKALTEEEKGGNINKSPRATPQNLKKQLQKNIKKVLDKLSTT